MTKKIILVLLSFIFSLACAEFIVRVVSQYNPQVKFLTYNPYQVTDFDRIVDWKTLQAGTQCVLPPGYNYKGFITNSHGFLFPELPYEKKSGEFRILLLGDSFAVGVVPYKDHFLQILETKLNEKRYPFRIQAINLGISCIGTGVYLKALEIEGLRYHPDVIILGFYVGNDFSDVDSDKDRINTVLSISENRLVKMLYISKLFAYISNTYKINAFAYKPDPRAITLTNPPQVLGVFSDDGVTYDPFQPTWGKQKHITDVQDIPNLFTEDRGAYANFASVKDDILTIRRLTEEYDAHLIVLLIPAEIQVNEQLLEEVLSTTNMKREELNIQLPQEKLAQFLESQNIAYIDLLPFFLQSPNPSVLYQPLDTHINTYGNQLVSDVLLNYFTKKVFLIH